MSVPDRTPTACPLAWSITMRCLAPRFVIIRAASRSGWIRETVVALVETRSRACSSSESAMPAITSRSVMYATGVLCGPRNATAWMRNDAMVAANSRKGVCGSQVKIPGRMQSPGSAARLRGELRSRGCGIAHTLTRRSARWPGAEPTVAWRACCRAPLNGRLSQPCPTHSTTTTTPRRKHHAVAH